MHLSQLACTPTALVTSKKPTSRGILWRLIPTDTLLERRSIPMEEDQSTNKALLPPRTFARAKCTFREDTLWLIHRYYQKRSLDGSKLAAIHCTARSSFTVETYTIPQTDYDYHDYYDDRSERDYYGQSQFADHINEFRLHYYINGNGRCTWQLLPTDRISTGLPAAPRVWLRASQERQSRLSIFATGETTLWFETTTSWGTTFWWLIGESNQSRRFG